MELHFFPGQNVLAIKKGNFYVSRYEAWGGPSAVGTDPRMPEEPTWPGTYVIHSTHSYVTPTWPFSKIKWGTPLQDKPQLNDVYYQLPSKKWGSVKKDTGIERKNILQTYFNYYGKMKVPATWVFNDFGPMAIRWFKDTNGNKILDKNETLSGQMFHTTPQNEAENALGKTVQLGPSHGCIHLNPRDRDTMLNLGAFKPQTIFVVHNYNEKI
jgi:hypothetical protein